jgi:23S rRNA pseudouridine2605 synthase
MIRLQKILSQAGIASRRAAEKLILEGRVSVNSATVRELGTKADPARDDIRVDGRRIKSPERLRYTLLNRPLGYATTRADPQRRRTVIDLLEGVREYVYPVGRLDYDTEGLLLLTNDGELKRQLELPSTGVVRHSRAWAFGTVTQAQLEDLSGGVTIEGMRYGSIDANLERRTGRNCWIQMSLTEGKNREVRRVLEHLGLQVSRLIRTGYGPFTLAGLEPGAVAEVDRNELAHFRNSLK